MPRSGGAARVVEGDALARSVDRLTSPELIGREQELAALLTTVLLPPAVAVVAGEPGVGKTRLVRELLARPGRPRPRGPPLERRRDRRPASRARLPAPERDVARSHLPPRGPPAHLAASEPHVAPADRDQPHAHLAVAAGAASRTRARRRDP